MSIRASVAVVFLLILSTTSAQQEFIFSDSFETPADALIAPPLEKGVGYSLYDASRFLYTGDEPVQRGMDPDLIAREAVAVIRGRVLDRAGSPQPGVTVQINGREEFGLTVTRSDGWFDMVVNGGGRLTVALSGFDILPLQRSLSVPWEQYVVLDDCVVTELATKVDTIELDVPMPMQIAEGPVTEDDAGSRQPMMLFPPDINADMVMPDGSRQPLARMNVRATEYTVGPRGPAAMPGSLPVTTNYTYAVELSVDEAMAAGATTVSFDQPVPVYLENYLQFPVGKAVPTGYYDTARGIWIPLPDGVVVGVVGNAGGLAELDFDGDGNAEDVSLLDSYGVSAAERQVVASKYPVGQTLWRASVDHFTPFDLNDVSNPGDGVPVSKPVSRPQRKNVDDPCEDQGSVIECQNRVLGQQLAIQGTDLTLNYRNDRVLGRNIGRILDISLGAPAGAFMTRIELKISVAGQVFERDFPVAGGSFRYVWDGLDAYGRSVDGPMDAVIDLKYISQLRYCVTGWTPGSQNFGSVRINAGCTPSDPFFNIAETENTRRQTVTLNSLDYRLSGIGGWSMNVHHRYEPVAGLLLYGDGREETTPAIDSAIIETVAGGGVSLADQIPATEADFLTSGGQISGLAVLPDGQLLIALDEQHVIRQVGLDGLIQTIAGTMNTSGFSGDAGLASAAMLNRPGALAIGRAGEIYLVDEGNQRIRMIDTSGVISTVAGGGLQTASDGADALQVALTEFSELAVGPAGNIFFGQTNPNNTWAISPSGQLSELFALISPLGMAIDPQGRLFASSEGRTIDYFLPGGVLQVAFGQPTEIKGLNLFAAQPRALAFTADGDLIFSDGGRCLRQIESPIDQQPVQFNGRFANIVYSGPALTLAADANNLQGCSNDTATAAEPHSTSALLARFGGDLVDIEVAADGSVLIADATLGRVRRLRGSLEPATTGNRLIADADLPLIYQFDVKGRHLQTFHSLTGATLYTFDYSDDGLLTGIVDSFGQRTVIERATDGSPVAVVAALGQRTTLGLDANGYLANITNGAGETVQAQYDEQGLMTRYTTARGDATNYVFNERGELESFVASDGYGLSFTETRINENNEKGLETKIETSTGAISRSAVVRLSDGNTVLRNTNRDGAIIQTMEGRDGSLETEYASGNIERSSLDTRPRLGAQIASSEVFIRQTPAGKTLAVTTERMFTEDQNNPLLLTQLTQLRRIGARQESVTYNGLTQTLTSLSPTGRMSETTINGQGQVTSSSAAADLSTTSTVYDSFGRVSRESTGDRFVQYEYDSLGRRTTETDAAGNQRTFEYNNADRVSATTSPAGRRHQFDYDANGNLTELTMPNGQVHRMTYTAFNEQSSYQAPGAGLLSQVYDLDRQRTQVTAADGSAQVFDVSPGGRMLGIDYPEANVTMAYRGNTGLLQSTQWSLAGGSRSQLTTMAYDGDLPTSIQTGADEFRYRYDTDLRLAGVSLNAGPELAYIHNDDDQVIAYGPYVISRDGPAGAPDSYSDGTHTISLEFDTSLRVQRRTHVVAGTTVYDLTLGYDPLSGRLTSKTQTANGITQSFTNQFNADGELTEVRINGAVQESYAYDDNSNRQQAGSVTATFDAADQLLTLGATSYQFDANGRLSGRGNDSFTYSTRGELLSATLEDGTQIDYTYDGLGRMVGRTDTQGTTSYLFGDANNPFQLSASRSATGVLSEYLYDEADLLIGIRRGGEIFHVASDQVGSPMVIIDNLGTVVRVLSYSSFGEVISDTNPNFDLALGFAGGIADAATGLVRFGFRDYEPASGRWLSRDPLLFGGGQFNLYAYVGNNPIEFRDPTGMFCAGGSQYDKYGAGATVCYKNGRWSICIDVGFGFGGGATVQPFAAPSDTLADAKSVSVGGSIGCGPVALGLDVKLDNCGSFSSKLGCQIGTIDLCKQQLGLGNAIAETPAQVVVNGKLKCKASLIIKGTVCVGTNSF